MVNSLCFFLPNGVVLMSLKTLIIEGGAMRGVFSTGLLDGFLEEKFNPFDLYIGVSSGASNIAAYLAEMPGRNAKIYLDYSLRPEFISYSRFLLGGHLLDLDWLWEITIREIRLDSAKIYSKGKPFIAVLTDIKTGKSYYKTTSAQDLENILKASSAMPLIYRGYPVIEGCPFADGSLSDPLPVKAAIDMGAGRIMVVRSRVKSYIKRRSIFDHVVRFRSADVPQLIGSLRRRADRYNKSVSLIRNPPPGVSIIEICPPDDFRVSRLTRDIQLLREGYEQGRAMAKKAVALWPA